MSEPCSPAEVGSLATSDARDAVIAAGAAYLADQSGGLQIVSVADPRRPAELARILGSTTDQTWSVAVADGRALAAQTPAPQ